MDKSTQTKRRFGKAMRKHTRTRALGTEVGVTENEILSMSSIPNEPASSQQRAIDGDVPLSPYITGIVPQWPYEALLGPTTYASSMGAAAEAQEAIIVARLRESMKQAAVIAKEVQSSRRGNPPNDGREYQGPKTIGTCAEICLVLQELNGARDPCRIRRELQIPTIAMSRTTVTQRATCLGKGF